MTKQSSSGSARVQGSKHMKFLKTLLLPMLVASVLAPAAVAQINIGVINEQRVLRESAVGQHIAGRLQAIAQEIDNELSAMNQPMQQATEQLNAETSIMNEEQIRSRPDLVQRIQTLNQQAQQYELIRRAREQEYRATERQAMGPVLEALQPILEEVVVARGLDILVDRSNLVYSTAEVDISADVIALLDARLPAVPVNRVRLPQNAAAAPE
jgi:outer membrane protein